MASVEARNRHGGAREGFRTPDARHKGTRCVLRLVCPIPAGHRLADRVCFFHASWDHTTSCKAADCHSSGTLRSPVLRLES